MEDSYNVDPANSEAPKTSSTDGKNSDKTTGESQVQNGEGVIKDEIEIPADKAEEPEEYIEQANNNTAVANQSPVQNGKGMTMLATIYGGQDDDDDDDSDNNDDPLTEITIGDDPDETKNKIPVF